MRFFVKTITGMCVGAGMFVVVDGYSGNEMSVWTYWRDEAEAFAKRLNLAATRDEVTP